MNQQSNPLMVNLVGEPWVGKFNEDDLMQFRIVILVLVPYGAYLSKVCIYTNCKMVLHILNHLTSRIGEIFINKCKKKREEDRSRYKNILHNRHHIFTKFWEESLQSIRLIQTFKENNLANSFRWKWVIENWLTWLETDR